MLRFLVPLILGAAAVAQAGMNRRVGAVHGLPAATLLSNGVLLVASLGMFFILGSRSTLPAGAGSVSPFLYFMPGLLGITLVAGIPWAISCWGAGPVFVGLIASQVVCGLLWDVSFEGRAVGLLQGVGILFCLAGALLVNARSG